MLFILFFEKKILKFISPLEFFHFIILSKQLLTTEKTKSSLEEVKVFIFLLIDYELQYGDAATQLFIDLLNFYMSIFKC